MSDHKWTPAVTSSGRPCMFRSEVEEVVAALEQQVKDEIKSRDGWRVAWKKSERRIELAQNAMVRAQPMTHELDGAIAIWEVAWNELREALAGDEA